jgi:hypothetical protein
MRAMPSFTSRTDPTSSTSRPVQVRRFDFAEEDVLDLTGAQRRLGSHMGRTGEKERCRWDGVCQGVCYGNAPIRVACEKYRVGAGSACENYHKARDAFKEPARQKRAYRVLGRPTAAATSPRLEARGSGPGGAAPGDRMRPLHEPLEQVAGGAAPATRPHPDHCAGSSYSSATPRRSRARAPHRADRNPDSSPARRPRAGARDRSPA